MKKILLLNLLFSINITLVAQITKWNDSVFTKITNPEYPPINCVVRTIYVDNEVKKRQLASSSYNPSGNTAFLDFEYWGYDGNIEKKISYGWSIFYDTILFNSVAKITKDFGIIEDYIFYQSVENEDNIGSVKIHKYYKNGKKIRKEYAPGEKWADLPYDPDSLFFELPKLLQLGDSILYIKHKYPRPE